MRRRSGESDKRTDLIQLMLNAHKDNFNEDEVQQEFEVLGGMKFEKNTTLKGMVLTWFSCFGTKSKVKARKHRLSEECIFKECPEEDTSSIQGI